ncbi:MAG: hypothetical protein RLZZ15_1091 [Verrucomicrobiota bacterium]|jgi:N-acetylmuramoyl-L-alanine amidase
MRSLRLAATFVLAALWSAPVTTAAPALAPTLSSARHEALRAATDAAVVRAVAFATDTLRSGVRLLSTTLDGPRLTLDFSRELLDLGLGSLDFEHFLRASHRAAVDVLHADLAEIEIDTRIAGIPLPRWFELDSRTASVPQFSPPQAAPLLALPPGVPPATGALAGRRLAISPGHGYYLNASNAWVLQRDFYQGVVEDFVNHDFITLLGAELTAVGADVRPTRNLDRAAGNGLSGRPRWQEAARYHAQFLGAPTTVWNEPGFDHLSQDIRCRPLYANFVAADLLVSIHNNGGGGTGTETLYDNANSVAAESKRLADLLHGKVIAAIRRDYNPTWADRRVQGFNGSYGENRLATRPAVIVEVAFMDRPTPDNAAIQDERFRRLVARAIAEGIGEFLDGLAPVAPDTLVATGDATGIALTWADRAVNEAGYRIERRDDANGAFAPLAALAANITSYRDTTAAPGSVYRYRVAATDAAGAATNFSNEATSAVTRSAGAIVLTGTAPATPPTVDWGEAITFSFSTVDEQLHPVADAAIDLAGGFRDTAAAAAESAGSSGATGRAAITLTVPSGQADGVYDFRFVASKPGYAAGAPVTRQIRVSHARPAGAAPPAILAQPVARSVGSGASVTFAARATGDEPLSYQWQRNGLAVAGATSATLTLPAARGEDAGTYTLVVANSAGSVATLGAALAVRPAAWLTNLSVRATLAGGAPLAAGFVTAGGAKDVLVRAAGPTLAPFGVPGAMIDPRLELFRGSGRFADNNDWPAALAPAMAGVGAFPFGAASRDAAALATIDGAHTAQASGAGAGTVLVEVYDAGASSASRLVNLSARHRVGTGADILIAGFFVSGAGAKHLLVRAVGPTLTVFGVTGTLADPRLEVRDANGVVATNDDWDGALAATFAQAGAFALPSGSRDAALVVTLAAGRGYTAQVAGANSSTGEALVEIYELP